MNNPEQIYKQWNRWFDIVGYEVTQLAHVDDVFWQIQAIIRANDTINKAGVFQDWLGYTYVQTVTTSLRRLVDSRKDTISLTKLLNDFRKHATILTRDRYVSLHSETTRRFADDWFNDLAGAELNHIPMARIQDLSKQLDDAFQDIKQYANDFVTHKAVKSTSVPLTFNDVREALVEAFSVYSWCSKVLRSSMPTSAVPVIQYDWLEAFRVPWLPDPKEVPDYKHLDDLMKK